MTIPQLEFLAATIAARLTLSVPETLRLTNIKTYYWCDSSTVLAWIEREYLWCTFVWNKVQEINQSCALATWNIEYGRFALERL